MRSLELVLFDLMAHSVQKSAGLGDQGVEGLKEFVKRHHCNNICTNLGLSPLSTEDVDLAERDSVSRYPDDEDLEWNYPEYDYEEPRSDRDGDENKDGRKDDGDPEEGHNMDDNFADSSNESESDYDCSASGTYKPGLVNAEYASSDC